MTVLLSWPRATTLIVWGTGNLLGPVVVWTKKKLNRLKVVCKNNKNEPGVFIRFDSANFCCMAAAFAGNTSNLQERTRWACRFMSYQVLGFRFKPESCLALISKVGQNASGHVGIVLGGFADLVILVMKYLNWNVKNVKRNCRPFLFALIAVAELFQPALCRDVKLSHANMCKEQGRDAIAILQAWLSAHKWAKWS